MESNYVSDNQLANILCDKYLYLTRCIKMLSFILPFISKSIDFEISRKPGNQNSQGKTPQNP